MKTIQRTINVSFAVIAALLIFTYWYEILWPLLDLIVPFGSEQIPRSGPLFWLLEMWRWGVTLVVASVALTEILGFVSHRSHSIPRATDLRCNNMAQLVKRKYK